MILSRSSPQSLEYLISRELKYETRTPRIVKFKQLIPFPSYRRELDRFKSLAYNIGVRIQRFNSLIGMRQVNCFFFIMWLILEGSLISLDLFLELELSRRIYPHWRKKSQPRISQWRKWRWLGKLGVHVLPLIPPPLWAFQFRKSDMAFSQDLVTYGVRLTWNEGAAPTADLRAQIKIYKGIILPHSLRMWEASHCSRLRNFW